MKWLGQLEPLLVGMFNGWSPWKLMILYWPEVQQRTKRPKGVNKGVSIYMHFFRLSLSETCPNVIITSFGIKRDQKGRIKCLNCFNFHSILTQFFAKCSSLWAINGSWIVLLFYFKKGSKRAQIPKFRIFERYWEFLYFSSNFDGFCCWIECVRAFGGMSADFLPGSS